MISPPKQTPAPKIDRIKLKEWNKGTITAFDAGRTPIDGLLSAGNVMLTQDGTISPRPSLVKFGPSFPGTLLGDLFEFVRLESGTPVNYLVGMFNVSGTVKPYISKDRGSWLVCNGKTYDASAPTHFFQADDKIGVLNGKDNLSYLDLPTLAVVPFVALTTPGLPTLTKTGLAGTGIYTYYIKITANSTIGETAASAEASITVDRTRDTFDASNKITATWSAVPNAKSYNVYLGTVSGQEFLLARGVNGTSFTDDGSLVLDITTPAPAGDTTAGPKCTRGVVINGIIFLVGDADNLRYVRNGGIGTAMWDFSPFNGGGWTEVGRGTKEFPVVVKPFRTGQGLPAVTVLCRGTNGSGKRYIMDPKSIDGGNGIVINYYDVEEDNGQDGTDAPDTAVLYRDALWYLSKDGFKTTGTKPQLQNLLSTTTVSETIINDVKNINYQYIDKACGIAYQQRLYFAVPVGASINNEIWVIDLQRDGAWMKPWNIAAQTMVLYNDNSGTTHFLIVSGNVLYELTESQATMDDTVPFRTSAASGFIKFSDDGLEWGKVIDVTFVLLRPQGNISFTVSGKTEEESLETVGQESFTADTSVAGWGESGWSGSPDRSETARVFGWSNMSEVPSSYGNAAEFVTVEVDEELQWLTWELNSSGAGVQYQLANVIIRYVNVGVKDLT